MHTILLSTDDKVMTTKRNTPRRLIEHVLLVEDSPSQAEKLKQALEKEGLTVCIKEDGPEALVEAANAAIELIVLDVELPTMSGYDICRQLKANPDTAHIPVVIMSARNHPIDTITGMEAGAIDFIPKGAFAEAILIHTIRYMNQERIK